jgi:ABC-type Fe3+-hydroxamate transport system substrate-binding protein
MSIDWSQIKTEEQKKQEAYENALESAINGRSRAYQEESDPLFFKTQRGEATIEEWQEKVEEIRQRIPYPEPPE